MGAAGNPEHRRRSNEEFEAAQTSRKINKLAAVKSFSGFPSSGARKTNL
jgi:hypothetical protein